MAEIGSLFVKIGGDVADLTASLKKAASAVNTFTSDINASLAAGFSKFDAQIEKFDKGIGRLGDSFTDIGGKLSLGVTLPLVGVGGAAIKMAADMEQAEVAFTTMLGSADKAKSTLKDLADFAAETPFEFPEIQEAARSLLAFNTPAEEIKSTLTQVGDIAAGVNAPIGELASLFGKARVQGTLFNDDINQLTERGIPVIQEFAKQFGVPESAIRKLAEEGKIQFSNLQEAFRSLTAEGGKFSGLMAAQSQTVSGLFSTLSDNVGRALADIGKEIIETFNLKEVIKSVGEFVGTLVERFKGLDPSIKRVIIIVAALVAAIGPFVLALGAVISAIPFVLAGLSTLAAAFAAVTGPVGLIAIGIGAAVALIIANWDAIVDYFTSGSGAGIFTQLKTLAITAFEAISAAVKRVVGIIIAIWQTLEPIFVGVIKTAFDFIGPLVTNALGYLTDIFGVFKAIFTGDWTALWSGLVNIFKRIWNTVVDVIVFSFTGLAKLLKNILANLGIDNAFTQALGSVVGTVDGFANKIKFSIASPKEAVVDFRKEVEKLAGSTKEATDKAGAGFKALADNGAAAFARLKASIAGIKRLNEDQYGNQQIQGIENVRMDSPLVNLNTDATIKGMQDLQARLRPILQNLREEWNAQWAAMGKVTVDFGSIASAAIAEFANLAAEQLAGLFTGETNAHSFFSGLLDIVAGFLQSFSKALIAAGTAALIAQTQLLTNPAGAIAAGIALAATASVLKNIMKQGPGGKGGGVPALATGTNFVPRDMLAQIHKGEAVVPAKFNSSEFFGGGQQVVVLETRVVGPDIYLSQEREKNSQRRWRGGR